MRKAERGESCAQIAATRKHCGGGICRQEALVLRWCSHLSSWCEMAIIGERFGAREEGVSSGQKDHGAEVEQSQGQMWQASLKGGEQGGWGRTMECIRPKHSGKIHIRQAVLGVLPSA